jgi:agmatinase
MKIRISGLVTLSLAASVIGILTAPVFAAEEFDPKTEKSLIQMLRDSPDAIPLEPRDSSRDVRTLRRDVAERGGDRKPGPINIQQTYGGLAFQGIPTFFKSPVALTPEDLKVGNVDIAIMGASVDLSVGQRGTAYGPQAIRTGEVYNPWGEGPLFKVAHPVAGYIDFTKTFNIVDYGDAPIDINSPERSILSVYEMVKEIAETGAVPVVVGGDHSLMYPDLVAISEVYGSENVTVVHFDAHFDGIPLMFGHYISHGAPVRRLIDEGHVKGENFIQIGLNSAKPGGDDLVWMRANKLKYHFMGEIDRLGWKAVMDKVLAEIEDGPEYVYISIDTDALDAAFAPGMGTPELGGMTIRELFPMLRATAVAKQVVGVELVEVNPVVDPSYLTAFTGVRILRETLMGMAMRKEGVTDPYYMDAEWLDHGAPVKEMKK